MDLRRAPLLRALVAAEPGTGRWLVLLQIHHLLQDHLGRDVVLGEITALLRGEGDRLPDPLPFRDFVAQARLGVPREEHERYFAGLLGDVSEPTAPFGLLDVRGDGTDVRTARVAVEEGLAGRLRERARALGVSPATVFHLVFARVLAVAAGREDVVFGTVLLGRMHAGAGADRIPGPFINTLPVRADTGAVGVAGAVAAMQAQLADLLAHEHAPLALAQRASGVAAPAPLFTSILNYHQGPGRSQGRDQESGGGGGLGGIRMLFSRDRTNYPLAVGVEDTGTGFAVTVDAVAPGDAAQVCALLLTCAAGLVGALEDDPAAPLRAVGVLDAAGREQVVAGWNDTAVPVAGVGGVHELAAVRAAGCPDVVAVACGGVWLSYGELDRRAGVLAGAGGCGAGAERVVGLCLERGVEMVTAMLAVWKAGAAYVPLDPGYPPARLAFMAADSGADLLVSRRGVGVAAELAAGRVVWLDDPAPVAPASSVRGRHGGAAGQLAYVIYTSGSTGEPKGCRSVMAVW